MRRATLILPLVVLVVLSIAALVVRSEAAWTLGVPSNEAVVTLQPGQEVCQGPVRLTNGVAATGVTLQLGTFFKPAGPPLAVRAARGGKDLARGRIAGGYPDIVNADRQSGTIAVPDTPFDLCVRNEGQIPVALYGTGGAASAETVAVLNGRELAVDIDVRFTGPERSFLARLPELLRRASLWRPDLVSPALLVGLLVIILAAATLLLPWLLETVDKRQPGRPERRATEGA